ncbi:hypothetical protein MAR_013940 [Mya arenaria]|uniref:Secreted protein n=1 Tax=Mya arenaria TaxID=6604 RepID=A0ABY7G5B4_MYAAR|nr:hypothetical protein MAR_013940 [Mya arenaria]
MEKHLVDMVSVFISVNLLSLDTVSRQMVRISPELTLSMAMILPSRRKSSPVTNGWFFSSPVFTSAMVFNGLRLTGHPTLTV